MNTHSPTLQTLADLVRINSVNPAYEGGKPEAEIGRYVRNFFHQCGLEVWEQEVFPERPNVIARLPGRIPDRRVIFEAHMDTAGVAGMRIPPFEPEISGGRLYGRGACDTKAGLAAMMQALASLKRDGITPPAEIWVAATADEEFAYRGVVRLCESLVASAGVVAEPTGMRCVVASKGCVRWRIRCHGKAAHSSRPELGVNAILHMARILLAIEEDTQRLSTINHPLLGRATCNVGIVSGGTQVNVVPEECSIELDRRLLPGEEPREILERYRQMLAGLKRTLPSLDVEMGEPMLEDIPLETSTDAPVVLCAAQVLRQAGLNPDPAGVPFGSDASKLARAGIPSVILGPGSIDQAHAAIEYVDCTQVEQAFECYRQFMMLFE